MVHGLSCLLRACLMLGTVLKGLHGPDFLDMISIMIFYDGHLTGEGLRYRSR